MKGNTKQYSFSSKIYMLSCLIRTKLFYRTAKIIRFPFDIRNGHNISLGRGFACGRMCRIEVANKDKKTNEICINIGEHVRIGDFVHISALESVTIGNNCGIGPKTLITDINKEFDPDKTYYDWKLTSKPVKIGSNVWIGESVCILPGVTIGDGVIVGALSNVTKSIPPYSIAAGNPAKVIKTYNFETKKWEKCTK